MGQEDRRKSSEDRGYSDSKNNDNNSSRKNNDSNSDFKDNNSSNYSKGNNGLRSGTSGASGSQKEHKFRNTEEQCSLLIEQISNTDTYKEFESEVLSCGLTTKFWINKRSKTCVVVFHEKADAIKAMLKFSDMTWPRENGQKLRTKLIQNTEVSPIITQIQKTQNITRPEQQKFLKEDRGDDYDRRRNDRKHSYDRYSSRERERERDRERGKDNKDRYRSDRYDRQDKDDRDDRDDRNDRNDRRDRGDREDRNDRSGRIEREYRPERRERETSERQEKYERNDRNKLSEQPNEQERFERKRKEERVEANNSQYSPEQRTYDAKYSSTVQSSRPISSSFFKTSFQPSIYYTVQSQQVVAARKASIDNYFRTDKKN